jgi:hypothetical protein
MLSDSKWILWMALGGVFLNQPAALADQTISNQPYIDQVKKEIEKERAAEGKPPEPGAETGELDPYIQSERKKLEQEKPPESGESYIEKLRASDPRRDENQSNESFTELEKAKLESKSEGGAIQALLEGRSELEPKKTGTIRHAYGLRYGASLNRDISSGGQSVGFNQLYGDKYAYDVTLFYEFQPFHHEFYGNFGFMFIGGVGYYRGQGKFSINLPKPGGTGESFGTTSNTQFQFFTLPFTAAVNYRFNLFKFLRPYAFVGPTAVALVEMRNDPKSGGKTHTEGFQFAGGVAVLLDWIAPGGSWDMYTDYGVHHYYLTVEYSRLTTFTNDINLSIYGLTAGLTFEY